MKHVLETTGENPVGEGAIKSDRVMVGEAAIDPIVPQSLNRVIERG
jgi:hypothetical protein